VLKLQADHRFYKAEADLFRAGPEAYVNLLALTLTNKMEAAGGIGPFEFWCDPADGVLSPIPMHAREL